MADIKDTDPALYAYVFKEGVEAAQEGRSFGSVSLLTRDDCKPALLDGYTSTLAHTPDN